VSERDFKTEFFDALADEWAKFDRDAVKAKLRQDERRQYALEGLSDGIKHAVAVWNRVELRRKRRDKARRERMMAREVRR
jgi:hypothetical protein